MVIPPADAGDQQQAETGDSEAERSARPDASGHGRSNQQTDHDGDAATTRGGDTVAAALAGLVQQLPAQGIHARRPGQRRAEQGHAQQRGHHEPGHDQSTA
ncbi:hypothetical protein D3C81_1794660 [compost metagenome]